MSKTMWNIEVGEVKRKDNENMIMLKVHYLYILKCHNEISLIKHDIFAIQYNSAIKIR